MSSTGEPDSFPPEHQSAEFNDPSVANEDRDERLTRVLSRIRAEAIFARDWWSSRDRQLGAPLEPVVRILSANNLIVSEGLGEDGFRADNENNEIVFNAHVIRGIEAVIKEIFPDEDPLFIDEAARAAIGLYVFHELTHILQKFLERQLAANLKRAFTPDELSKVDLAADVRAAHCATLTTCALTGNDDVTNYLETYRTNLLLSYQLLVRAFSIKDQDHKKKRALGLLTSVVLSEGAILAIDDRDAKIELAVRPAFTSVDQIDGSIVALTCGYDGWQILFHGDVATNRLTVLEMWDLVGTTDPADILGLLQIAYTNLI